MPRVEITDGPSKFDLMLALFDRMPDGSYRHLKFNIQSELEGVVARNYCTAVVHGCSRVPGPDVWSVTGEVMIPGAKRWEPFEGVYSPGKRIGHMDFVDD